MLTSVHSTCAVNAQECYIFVHAGNGIGKSWWLGGAISHHFDTQFCHHLLLAHIHILHHCLFCIDAWLQLVAVGSWCWHESALKKSMHCLRWEDWELCTALSMTAFAWLLRNGSSCWASSTSEWCSSYTFYLCTTLHDSGSILIAWAMMPIHILSFCDIAWTPAKAYASHLTCINHGHSQFHRINSRKVALVWLPVVN